MNARAISRGRTTQAAWGVLAERAALRTRTPCSLGLEVVISEMDVQLCKGGTLTDQQARFHDIVAACLTQGTCTAVTFWGITD